MIELVIPFTFILKSIALTILVGLCIFTILLPFLLDKLEGGNTSILMKVICIFSGGALLLLVIDQMIYPLPVHNLISVTIT